MGVILKRPMVFNAASERDGIPIAVPPLSKNERIFRTATDAQAVEISTDRHTFAHEGAGRPWQTEAGKIRSTCRSRTAARAKHCPPNQSCWQPKFLTVPPVLFFRKTTLQKRRSGPPAANCLADTITRSAAQIQVWAGLRSPSYEEVTRIAVYA